MSGYLAIIAEIDKSTIIRKLFDDSELIIRPLNSQLCLFYYSTSQTFSGGRLFQGYAIDHERQAIIFSGAKNSQLPRPSTPIDGSYFTAELSDSQATFGADLNGYVPMCWFNSRSVTAISDSYLSLVNLRTALGLPCSINPETVAGRMWMNSMAYQQLGTKTFCKEVSICTPGTTLSFSYETRMLHELPANLPKQYETAIESHADAIHQAAARMIGVIKGYAESGGLVSLSLSGGMDSRACLAAALRAGIGDSLFVGSKDNGRADYPIARELAERFGFQLNRSSRVLQGTLAPRDPLTTWSAMSLGLYDALYASDKFRRLDRPVFAVGGQGAEISKGNYGWRQLTKINMPRQALAQASEGLTRIGVDKDDKWGSEWHYLAFRNAIHGGRGLLNSDYISRPAAQVPIIGLSRSELNEFPAPRKGQYNVIGDLLVCLNPQLALHRFDSHAKDFTPERLERRLKAIGGPIAESEIPDYSSIGSATPSAGILKSHVSCAENLGFAGGANGATLWPFAERSIKEFRELIDPDVISLAKQIPANDRTAISSQSKEGTALSKLVALSPLTL
ncbi:hypothetical protein [Corynebacterium sp.]|uniref:hypothetical protein n=1 Tax=Corynebacterium sp. TaxID=1720 RepID=UPI0026DBC8BD|nr:hypothetical protein [Corynebacterium sp.]MDO5031282.1 hypothetical protein [Corynebacterium sp.]